MKINSFIMDSSEYYIGTNDTLEAALNKFQVSNSNNLIVMDDASLPKGSIYIYDLISYLTNQSLNKVLVKDVMSKNFLYIDIRDNINPPLLYDHDIIVVLNNNNFKGIIKKEVINRYYLLKEHSLHTYLNTIINSIPYGIMAITNTSEIIVYNNAVKKLLGLRKNSIIGKSIYDVSKLKNIFKFIKFEEQFRNKKCNVQKYNTTVTITHLKINKEVKGKVIIFQ
ncbi:PAS domain-containing protein [Clostridiisalibacter paucivorans]|uniref:PAS domain-containing protein n=1 Tax=Clostridiisalibacter paucivorans TaxID=408753 RepID=UPI00047C9967|nr:PAS domain-containing protein [Clostridiisalibacter paucivorans]